MNEREFTEVTEVTAGWACLMAQRAITFLAKRELKFDPADLFEIKYGPVRKDETTSRHLSDDREVYLVEVSGPDLVGEVTTDLIFEEEGEQRRSHRVSVNMWHEGHLVQADVVLPIEEGEGSFALYPEEAEYNTDEPDAYEKEEELDYKIHAFFHVERGEFEKRRRWHTAPRKRGGSR